MDLMDRIGRTLSSRAIYGTGVDKVGLIHLSLFTKPSTDLNRLYPISHIEIEDEHWVLKPLKVNDANRGCFRHVRSRTPCFSLAQGCGTDLGLGFRIPACVSDCVGRCHKWKFLDKTITFLT